MIGLTNPFKTVAGVPRNRAALWIVLGILVLAGAGGVALSMSRTDKQADTATKSAGSTTAKDKYSSVSANAQQLLAQGKDQEAAKAIEAYIAANPPTTPEAKVYVTKLSSVVGATYLNTEDYNKSIVSYQRALDLSVDSFDRMSALHGLAITYTKTGDKQKAIDAYKAAIEIAKPLAADNSQASRFVDKDTRAITQLGGTL